MMKGEHVVVWDGRKNGPGGAQLFAPEHQPVGVIGSYHADAWRTRVSNCRTEFGMRIENRVRVTRNGVKVSEYCYRGKAA